MGKTSLSSGRGQARSGTSAFMPRARLLKILGAELISDEVVAIGELVKNAHDADAGRVTVRFERASEPSGRITVLDDGDGMDIDTVLGRWMQPASSAKGRNGMRRTHSGRRMLGEKGVGRFAVDKLGARCELVTRPRGGRDEVRATFDWDAFSDDQVMLHELESRWELRKPSLIKSHGTALVLTNLRQSWTERTYRRLCSRLSRLVSPLESDGAFRIAVESDEFPDYGEVLKQGYLDRSPYRIHVAFDGDRTLEIRFNDGRVTKRRWSGREDLSCGPVEVRVHAFDLESDAVARVGQKLDVRAWLRQWSGVSIYRDGFRIWPYGEPHDDWLRLDRRRVNNPTVRLSNNQVVGSVYITADGNPDLRDQTNREGLINNGALEDLRRLVYEVLQIVEAERQAIRRPVTGKKSNGTPRVERGSAVADELEKMAGSRDVNRRLATRLRALARRAREDASRDASGQEHLMGSLAELAAAGRCAASAGRDLVGEVEGLRDLVTRKLPPDSAAASSLPGAIEELQERVALIAGLSGGMARGRHFTDITRAVQAYADLVRPAVEDAGSRLELRDGTKALVRATIRPESLHRVLNLVVENSLHWGAASERPRIRISTGTVGDHAEILISDNGPGVAEEMRGQLFEPGSSLRDGAMGMGLCIARVIVGQHGGSISLLDDRRRKGANIVIRLPRKKANGRSKGPKSS